MSAVVVELTAHESPVSYAAWIVRDDARVLLLEKLSPARVRAIAHRVAVAGGWQVRSVAGELYWPVGSRRPR